MSGKVADHIKSFNSRAKQAEQQAQSQVPSALRQRQPTSQIETCRAAADRPTPSVISSSAAASIRKSATAAPPPPVTMSPFQASFGRQTTEVVQPPVIHRRSRAWELNGGRQPADLFAVAASLPKGVYPDHPEHSANVKNAVGRMPCPHHKHAASEFSDDAPAATPPIETAKAENIPQPIVAINPRTRFPRLDAKEQRVAPILSSVEPSSGEGRSTASPDAKKKIAGACAVDISEQMVNGGVVVDLKSSEPSVGSAYRQDHSEVADLAVSQHNSSLSTGSTGNAEREIQSTSSISSTPRAAEGATTCPQSTQVERPVCEYYSEASVGTNLENASGPQELTSPTTPAAIHRHETINVVPATASISPTNADVGAKGLVLVQGPAILEASPTLAEQDCSVQERVVHSEAAEAVQIRQAHSTDADFPKGDITVTGLLSHKRSIDDSTSPPAGLFYATEIRPQLKRHSHEHSFPSSTASAPAPDTQAEDERDAALESASKSLDAIILEHKVAMEDVTFRLSQELTRLDSELTDVAEGHDAGLRQQSLLLAELIDLIDASMSDWSKCWLSDSAPVVSDEADQEQQRRACSFASPPVDVPPPLRRATSTPDLSQSSNFHMLRGEQISRAEVLPLGSANAKCYVFPLCHVTVFRSDWSRHGAKHRQSSSGHWADDSSFWEAYGSP